MFVRLLKKHFCKSKMDNCGPNLNTINGFSLKIKHNYLFHLHNFFFSLRLVTLFQVIKELDDNIAKFNKNYMLLNDYLEDAGERLHHISSSATEVRVTSALTFI